VHKRIADRMREVIAGLGEKEKELRAAAGLPSLGPVKPKAAAGSPGEAAGHGGIGGAEGEA
jgi:hypothetical protein